MSSSSTTKNYTAKAMHSCSTRQTTSWSSARPTRAKKPFAIAEAKPDIVLMDIRMPGMGGIDATRRIVSAHPDIRVIALTIFDLDEYAFGALDAGASAFILKSSSPEALIRTVRIVASGEAVVEPRITRQLIDMYTRRIIPMPETDSEKEEPRRDIDSLSPREREVFYAIAQGLSNPEISDRFFLSPATVKTYVNRIFSKLSFRDRAQAIIYAYRNGLHHIDS